MKRSRRAAVLAGWTLLPALLTGCWDRREVNDIAIQMITAIDRGDKPGDMKAVIQAAVPRRMGGTQGAVSQGGSRPYITISQEGHTLGGMTVAMERKLPRDLIATHRRVFVVGESLARDGLDNVVDHIDRGPEMRLGIYFCVARGMPAGDIIRLGETIEEFPVEVFREIITRKMKGPASIRDFLVAVESPGKDPVTVAFSPDPAHKNQVTLDSVAIFRKLKLVGYVSDKEATALVSLLGKHAIDTMELTVPGDNGVLAARLSDLAVERKLKVREGEPEFFFTVKASARITENNSSLDLSNPVYLKEVEDLLGKELLRIYRSLFRKLQQDYQADSLGLGNMIYRKNPKLWKKMEQDWPSIYKEQSVSWKVDAHIIQTGIFGASSSLPEDEVKK